jgi:hypothetical protein
MPPSLVPRLRAFEMKMLYTKRTRLSAEQEREQGLEKGPQP